MIELALTAGTAFRIAYLAILGAYLIHLLLFVVRRHLIGGESRVDETEW